MSSLKNLIERLVITELKLILEKPEASADAPFGQYLFGSNRNDAPADEEENTESEYQFLNALEDHIVDNDSDRLQGMIGTLSQLRDSGQYSKYLKPPPGLVYRFVSDLQPAVAAKMLGISLEELNKHADKLTSTEDIPHSYTPRKTIASWSTSPRNSDFSSFPWRGSVSVVLVADTGSSGEFLFNPKNLKNIIGGDASDNLEREKEVVSSGPVQIIQAAFYYNKTGKEKYTRRFEGGNMGNLLVKTLK